MKKIIIDTDAGVDDAMSILLALNSQELDIIGFTTVHGNTELHFCTQNVLRILELANRPGIPVSEGTVAPLIREGTFGKYVHGDDGLGNTNLPAPSIEKSSEHAVDMIIRLVNEFPNEITLVALGPLTNIAVAIAKDRSIVKKIKEVIFMGGTYETLGNATPVASANLYHDPHAARIVYDSGIPIVSVGLDACKKFFFTEEQILSFSTSGKIGQFISSISKGIYIDFYSAKLGFRGCQSNDTPSIGYLIAPELFKTVLHHVDIEICGEFSTGQTVVDHRDFSGKTKNATICIDLDGNKLKEMFMDRVILG